MTCEYCGNQVPDDVSICPSCGAAVQRREPPKVQEPPQVREPGGTDAPEQEKEDDVSTIIGATAICFVIGICLICFCDEWYLRFLGGAFFIIIGAMCFADLFKKKKKKGDGAE